jgi:hypothetical protein
MGTTSSETGPQARNAIISRTRSSDGGGGSMHPASRNATIAGSARRRASAISSSVMEPW